LVEVAFRGKVGKQVEKVKPKQKKHDFMQIVSTFIWVENI